MNSNNTKTKEFFDLLIEIKNIHLGEQIIEISYQAIILVY